MPERGHATRWSSPGPPGSLGPSAESPSTSRVYCASCGTGASANDHYCIACGRELRLPDSPVARSVHPVEDTSAAMLRQAHHLLVTGNVSEAIPLLERLRAEHPERTALRAYLGVAYLRAARVIEAQEAIETALRLAPDDFTCRMAQGEFFARLGFYDKAVTQLDQALELATPGNEAYRAAFELRRFCQEKSKGLFYRQTALPRLPAALRRWRRGTEAASTTTSAAIQARSN